MTFARSGDLRIYYDAFGVAADPAVLLVSGLGSQCISYKEEFCERIAQYGYFVIRYDNRDAGLSSRFLASATQVKASSSDAKGRGVPYTLSDMASDGFAVLDELGIAKAHVVGTSMGGMIAQTMAIERSERLESLSSIMSTTGDPDVGQPTPAALELLLAPTPTDADEFVSRQLLAARTWGSPDCFDEARVRADAVRAFERSAEPAGAARQLKAIRASQSRSAALRSVHVPTLVIHGSADTLIDATGGRRTAEVIAGSELVIIEGMGHDRPNEYWDQLISLLIGHFQRS